MLECRGLRASRLAYAIIVLFAYVGAAAYFEVRKAGLAQKTTAEWLEIFDKLDIPAARYNSIDDLLTDPHLNDVGFFGTEDHPSEGRIGRTRPANTFSGGNRSKLTHTPKLGEHTSEVLTEAGYTADDIETMLTSGAALR